MIDNFAEYSGLGGHLWSRRVCRTAVQVFLAFRISTEKSEPATEAHIKRWSSQAVKVWEEGLLSSGDYRISSDSGETIVEDRRDSENCPLAFQPRVPPGTKCFSVLVLTQRSGGELEGKAERVSEKDLKGPWVCTRRVSREWRWGASESDQVKWLQPHFHS